MARWVQATAGATNWLASADCFLLAVTWVLAVAAVVTASCTAYWHFHSKTSTTATISSSGSKDSPARGFAGFKIAHNFPGRALIKSGKKLLISIKWGQGKKEDEVKAYDRAVMEEQLRDGDFLWQRRILMGERCQPPDFSGVIIYDDKGNQLSEFPARSPRLNIFHPSHDQSDADQQR